MNKEIVDEVRRIMEGKDGEIIVKMLNKKIQVEATATPEGELEMLAFLMIETANDLGVDVRYLAKELSDFFYAVKSE